MMQVWYAVAPGKDRMRFEELAKGLFPKDSAKCAAFLRHKSYMITPQLLKKHGIPFVKVSASAWELPMTIRCCFKSLTWSRLS